MGEQKPAYAIRLFFFRSPVNSAALNLVMHGAAPLQVRRTIQYPMTLALLWLPFLFVNRIFQKSFPKLTKPPIILNRYTFMTLCYKRPRLFWGESHD